MTWPFYYILNYLMVAGIRISSIWNKKSHDWISGRRQWYQRLQNFPAKSSNRIWFHVSSLGEFEQARPVIENLKQQQPEIQIILSFFSPSGYLVRSEYPHASVFYLPADLPGNAKKWIERIQPDMAVFVKYDLWPGYIKVLQDKSIPTALISAHWIPGGWFHSWSLPPVNTLLKKFNKIFFQTGEAIPYFREKGFNNIETAGDTRIDRCLALPKEAANRIPEQLKSTGPYDVVAGSTWPADERIIIDAISKLNVKALLAPHDVSKENIKRLIQSLPFPSTRLSDINTTTRIEKIVVVDTIGLLSVLYALGKIAYVGGGFGSGIHNTLEPMAHQKPLIFGKKYQGFTEAVAMVDQGGALTVSNGAELIQAIQYLQQPGMAEKTGKISFDYLIQHAGASERVTSYILDSLPYSAKK